MHQENTLEKPVNTLAGILTTLEDADDCLVNIDPAEVVGMLNDKVDAIHHVLERMKFTAEYLKELAKPLRKKASAIENAREQLREYVAYNMKQHGFDTLPGTRYKAVLRSNPEKIVISYDRQPTTSEAVDPDLSPFINTRVEFEWNHQALEEAFLKGRNYFGEVKVSRSQNHWVTFNTYVPESLEKKTKAKKELKK